MTGTCAVCELEPATIQTRLRFDGTQYAAVARCVDRAACRARVEAAGGRWDVGELDTASGPRGFTDAHRRAFEHARKWRERQAQT